MKSNKKNSISSKKFVFSRIIISSPNNGGFFLVNDNIVHKVDNINSTGLSYKGKRLFRGIQPGTLLMVHDLNSAVTTSEFKHNKFDDIHDVFDDESACFVVGTSNNAILRVDYLGNVTEEWQVNSVQDSCHVNCLTKWNGRIVFSAFGDFTEQRGYKSGTIGTGFVQDLLTGNRIIKNLSQPHSLTVYGENLLIANSESKSISEYSGDGKFIREKQLDGYTRGVFVSGNVIYVGLSKTRNIKDNLHDSAFLVALRADDWEEISRIRIPAEEIYSIIIIDSDSDINKIIEKIDDFAYKKNKNLNRDMIAKLKSAEGELEKKKGDFDLLTREFEFRKQQFEANKSHWKANSALLEDLSRETARLRGELKEVQSRLIQKADLVEKQNLRIETLEGRIIDERNRTDEFDAALCLIETQLSERDFENEKLKTENLVLVKANSELSSKIDESIAYANRRSIFANYRDLQLRKINERKLRLLSPLMYYSKIHEIAKYRRERKLIVGSRLFDREWYLEQNPDIRIAKIDPAVHYLIHGAYEGRQPSEFFDSTYYLLNNPDVAAAGINPLVHYIRHGAREGRQIASQDHRKADDVIPEAADMELKEMAPISVTGGIVRRISSLGKKIVSTEIENRVEHLNKFISYEKQTHSSSASQVNLNRLRVSWIVPDFEPGAGGHMTIFRIAHYLEKFGHDVNFFVQNPSHHPTGEAAYKTINQHFQPFKGRIELFDSELPVTTGDALIATDRFTCYPVDSMSGFSRKFYFVQDYETLFYPAGAEALLTNATYNFDFDCLCAGEWLHEMMIDKFGRWSVSWPLAYDPEFYRLGNDVERSNNRIAFYARYVTSRRAVELGFMALDILRQRGVDFEVDFFGWDLGTPRTGYRYTNHGVIDAQSLSHIYQRAAVGVVFSATNHSLVNKEMMACGLPVIDLDLDSVRKIFPPQSIAYATPTPAGIADAIQSLLESPERQEELRNGGLKQIDGLSWEHSARIVERALKDRISAAVTNV